MAKVVVIDNNIEMPTLILQNRNFDNIGSINEASDFNYKENFNDANECSFTIYKELESIYDEIYDHRLIYIPEFDERFEITVSVSDEDTLKKTVNMKSLCQAELSQVILRDIEINTEDVDIIREDYDKNFPTVFYRDVYHPSKYNDIWNSDEKYASLSNNEKKKILRESSLLHRLLSDKCSHYTIGHVDSTLWNIQRTFQISGTSVYDELIGEISEEIGCLFDFDSMTRTINVYDLYKTCEECGYRGNYTSDHCPKCNSDELIESNKWKDTTIYIDKDNLSSSISLETNASETKNCFYVTGGDDLLTATVINVNPTGSNYIYHFSEETLNDMPGALRNSLNSYEEEYNNIINGTSEVEKYYVPDDKKWIITNYNNIVSEVNKLFYSDSENRFRKICNNSSCKFKNYSDITKSMYEAIDLEGFLENSMMPTVDIDGIGIQETMNNIDNGFKNGYVEKNPNYEVYDQQFDEYNTAIEYRKNKIKNYKNEVATCNEDIQKIKDEAGNNPLTPAQERKISYLENKIDTYNASIKTLEEQIISIEEQKDDLYDELEENEIPEYIHVSGHYEYYVPIKNSKTKSAAETAIVKTAKMYCGASYYEISVKTDTYTAPKKEDGEKKNGSWIGKIVLTSLTEKEENSDEYKSLSKTFILRIPYEMDDDAYITYVQQQLQHATSDKDKLSEKQITSLGMSYSKFKKQLKYYSLSELKNLYQIFSGCLDVLIDSKMNDNMDSNITKLYDKYYNFYYSRQCRIEMEILDRETEIKIVNMVYLINKDFGMKETITNAQTGKTKSKYINIIGDFISEIEEYLNIKTWVTDEYYDAFLSYIREGDYNNSNYISDGADNAELVKRAKTLLEKATEELYKASTVQYTISSNINNLLSLRDYKDFKEMFAVGNWLHLGIDGNVYKLRLLSYSYGVDSPDSIEVEFSSVEKIWNAYSDIESVINSASSMATSYDAVMNQYDKTKETSTTVNNWITEGFVATTTKMSNNDNQEVLFDEHGILLRKKKDSVENEYEPYQTKLLSNGLYVTSDNWNTVEAGVGRIGYYNPDNNNEYVETYGIIAKTIIGKLFLGEELKIYNKSGGLKFDDNGLSITNGINGFYVNPSQGEEIFKITKGEESILSFNDSGDLSITGNINADTGTIANFIISEDALHTIKNGEYGFKKEGTIYFGSSGLSLSDQFSVDKDGKIIASNAELSGGKIANFNIATDSINTGNYNTDGTIYFGNNGLSLSTNFKVSKNGNMTANNATLNSGTFTKFKAIGNNDLTVTTIDDNIIIKDNVGDEYLGQVVDPYLQVRYSDITTNPESPGSRLRYAVKVQGQKITFQKYDLDSSKFVDNATISNSKRANHSNTYYETIETSNHATGRLFVDKNIYMGYDERIGVITPSGHNYEPKNNVGIYLPCADGSTHPLINRNNTGLKLFLGWDGSGDDGQEYSSELILRGKTVSLGTSGGTAVTSDERLKNSFKTLDEFDNVFMDIEPCAFKYNNGTSGRFHFGAKAQNIKNAFESNGYTTQDFGGFIQFNVDETDSDYQGVKDPMGLIYTEFTMWNTHMIQKALNLIESQQKEIEELKSKLEETV